MSEAFDKLVPMFEYEGMSTALLAGAPDPSPGGTSDEVSRLRARIAGMQRTTLDTRSLPTDPAIADLLPGSALKEGAAYSVAPSATLVMALLAGPSRAGSWCGVVGMPEFGVEAAAAFGIDLDRLVLVPEPGDQWLAVTSAIADVLTVVVTRPTGRMNDANVSRLAARLRQRGATLIVLGAWPQAEAMLSVASSRWSGLERGSGYLSDRDVTVTVSSRQDPVPRSATLRIPAGARELRRIEHADELRRPGADPARYPRAV